MTGPSAAKLLRASLPALVCLLVPSALPARAEEQPPHWVVSTRDCDQRIGGWCSRSCPKVYLARGDGRIHEVPHESLRASLRPGAVVVIFVHGSFLDWDSTVDRGDETVVWLEASRPPGCPPPHYVLFTWPSDPITAILPLLDVNVLGRRASLNGYYLARLIDELPPETPITLVGHSHGTRVVAGALHALAGGRLWDHALPRERLVRRPIHTVLAAAAMDRHWMNPGERYGWAWYSTRGLVHLRNHEDLALDLYPLRRPFSRRALGQVGFEPRHLVPLGDAAAGLVEVDVAPLLGEKHLWDHYTDRPEIARFLAPYVFHAQQFGRDPEGSALPRRPMAPRSPRGMPFPGLGSRP